MKIIAFRRVLTIVLLLCGFCPYAQNITTVAGGGDVSGENVPAQAGCVRPYTVVVNSAGDLIIADCYRMVIKKVSVTTGLMKTIAGMADSAGYSGDGGPATAAKFNFADRTSLAADAAGNIYVNDELNHRIRKINASGIVTTYAGTGTAGYSGDGGAAIAANIQALGIACDAAGNLYIADGNNYRIRKISGGTISTICGTGVSGFTGDGGPAIAAQVAQTNAITVNTAGEVWISDLGNRRIRKIALDGTISTVAGNGTLGFSGDDGPATLATIGGAGGDNMAVDATGNVYFSGYNAVRKISASGIITRYAGQYVIPGSYMGDGGPATAALFNLCYGIALDGAGNLFVADYENNVIRKVDGSGVINTYAGNNFLQYTGDNGPAINAKIHVQNMFSDTAGNVYFTDPFYYTLRKMTPSGMIYRVAGDGSAGFTEDSSLAIYTHLATHFHGAIDRNGTIYIAEAANHIIRKITPTGILVTVAFSTSPNALAADTAGNIFFTDGVNHQLKRINATGGTTVIAGSTAGYSGDGGPALAAQLQGPFDVAVDKHDNIYLLENYGGRVRKIDASGIITTIAGTGTMGYSGDGGPATAANIWFEDISCDDSGNVYGSQLYDHLIRKISAGGIITTFAGNGTAGFSGDGGAALAAQLNVPQSVVRDNSGNVYIGDENNGRIRFVCASDSIVSSIAISTPSDTICLGSAATFSATTTNAGASPTYHWQINGATGPGATNSTFTSSTFADGDTITCLLTGNNLAPCAINGDVLSNSIVIHTISSPTPSGVAVSASPAVLSYPGETITYTATYMNGGTSPTFQWYRNGVLVPGATTNPYATSAVSAGDNISVTVHTSAPCASPDSASGSTTVAADGVAYLPANTLNINLVPNPNNGQFIVSGSLNNEKEADIEIYNALGESVYKEHVTAQKSQLYVSVHMAEPAAGIYMLRITTKNGVDNYRFVVR